MRNLMLTLALLFTGSAAFALELTVDDILKSTDEPPPGVVFEIVESDDEALSLLIERIKQDIARLKQRFPEMDFAIVTHGREQFSLQRDNVKGREDMHAEVKSLVASNVPVHVCGTHASWYGVTAEDFPAYVNVSPTGPAQIAQYEELDWELIRVELED